MFLLGDDVLVAPVIEEGALSRLVSLPGEAEGIHAFTGQSYDPGTHEIAAPTGQPPVFYRPDSTFAPLFAGLAGVLGQ